ncbi:MAG: Amino acid kinase [Microgenomates group bacterium Gr01-1014_93]|nr:MAG: Amino acid kinase [Microgenomates group bacterium Gr01-1014_93]
MGIQTKKELLVIKLGGSVITYKDSQIPKPRFNVIRRIAKEILALQKLGYKIILIHGGGSFGHNLAKKYELIKGLRSKQSMTGFSRLLQSMNKLNLIITEVFRKLNLPIVSLPPHSFITQESGKLKFFDTRVIKQIINLGFIPVLYGDGVLDKNLGCSIISGDTIATYLGKKLKTKKVIFLSDVDGIFDNNPNNPNAKLIPEINNGNFDGVFMGIKSTGRNDVTGEMAGKLFAIKTQLKKTKVKIINGNKKGNLEKAVNDQKTGTTLFFN